MQFFKDSRMKTVITIIIAAFLLAAAFAGGNWNVGYADDTIPIVYDIDPDRVHVNTLVNAVLTGDNFIGTEYTHVRFLEPDGTLHDDIVPTNVYACASTYSCTKLDVTFPVEWFQNVGIAQVWVINHPDVEPEVEVAGPYIINIIDDLFLPIIMKNN